MAVTSVGIVIWGFSGTWEYPTIEITVASDSVGAPMTVEGTERVATRGGAAGAGAQLFRANGCDSCHTLNGQRKIGPSLAGVFGTTVELNDGRTTLIDDAYLAESILQPLAKRVAGYDDVEMPSYEGIVSVENARALAEYIKGLK